MPDQRPASLPEPRSRLPWRGVALGAIMGTLLCALTPWNDLVLGNTSLIGSFLPLGLIGLLALAIGANAVSTKLRARTIFSPADLSAALALGLIACTLPASGLMRYLPAGLIGLQYQAGTGPERAKLLTKLALPPSLLPSDDASAPIGGSDRTVNDYYNRAAEGSGDSMIGRVPWSKWVRPALAWGVLLASIYVAVLSLSAIVYRQWAVNERIPFPLATVYGLLIEAPRSGRALNGLLSSRAFWIAAAVVFAIHLLNGAHEIRPAVPQIPLKFDFNAMFTTPPWDRIDPFAKRGVVLFSVIGICYFVRSDVALSLWVCYLMLQIYRMLDPSRALELGHPAATDQAFGALLAYAASVVWIGRRHYRMVIRAMLGRQGTSDVAKDDVTPYGAAGWLLLVAVATGSVWLVWAGTGVMGALCIVLTALTVLMVVARVVAETGLFFVQVNAPVQQPMLLLAATDLPAVRASTNSFFFASLFTGFFTHDARESSGVYATHGLVLGSTQDDGHRRRLTPRAWGMLTALMLFAGFAVAGANTLVVEYGYGMSRAEPPSVPLNAYGTDNVPRNQIYEPTARFASGTLTTPHSPSANVALGAGVVVALSSLRATIPAWPIHPIGFLLLYTRPLTVVWFSIFCGWLAKLLLVRFGGSGLYRSAAYLFVGLMLGEIAAAAFWMLAAAVAALAGWPYKPYAVLP